MIKRIINKLQNYLNIHNEDPIIVKINKLESHISKYEFNPYLTASNIEVIHPDILIYTKAINDLLAQNLSKNYIKVQPINKNSVLTVHIGTFWTDQGNLLTNTNAAFKEWLEASKETIHH